MSLKLFLLLIFKLSFVSLQNPNATSNFTSSEQGGEGGEPLPVNNGDAAFVAICAILVFIMTPALGLFYGGLLQRKNLLHIMAQCFFSNGVVAMIWTLLGFSIAFGPSHEGFIGNHKYFVLKNVNFDPHPSYGKTIPFLLFFYFQSQFACITPSLIVGAIAERIRFWPMMVYIGFWSLTVYSPLAHWNWNADGWLSLLGAKDWAGGNVIHISGGVAAMACAMALEREKPRIEKWFPKPKTEHSYLKIRVEEEETGTFKDKQLNSVMVVLGTMILWFGWFGFNAGSALNAGNYSTLSLVTTNVTPAVTMLVWAFLDMIHKNGVITVNGMCIACVCALIGITPGAGYVRVWHTIIIGILSAVFPYYFMWARAKFEFMDDRLDVFAAHGIAGMLGGFSLGFHYCVIDMNNQCIPSPNIGANWGYGGSQIVYQMIGITATVAYAFVVSYFLFIIVMLIFKPFDYFDADESIGLDKMEIFEKDHLELLNMSAICPEVA